MLFKFDQQRLLSVVSPDMYSIARYPKLSAFKRDQFEYFTNWYVIIVKEILSAYKFYGNFDELAKLVNPPITALQAKDLMEQKTIQDLYKEILTLYDDRIKVMEELTYSEDFQLERLIEEEKNRTKVKTSSLKIDKFISVLQQRAMAFLGDTSFTGFDTTDIVGIKTIMKRFVKTWQTCASLSRTNSLLLFSFP